MNNIFDGLRVVDFTTNAAGPLSTAFLSDFGAEVIKIEKPKIGDDIRTYAPMFEGIPLPLLWLNRGKKSLVLDMKDEEAKEIARRLIATADVVVESFKPGTMEKFGLGYEEVKKINPRIIMCSVSAYGQTGPLRNKPGYDIVAQALSGIMDLTGDPQGEPVRSGTAIADYITGLNTYAALVSALYYRQVSGKGQYIDIALLDCVVSFNGLIETASIGKRPTRAGNHHVSMAPFGVFSGNDGSLVICAPSPRMWEKLCEAMGKSELANEPRFKTGADRLKHLNQLIKEIETWLKSFDKVDIPLSLLDAAGIACCKVSTTNEVLDDEQLKSRGMIMELETPDGVPTRKIRARGNPWKFSETQAVLKKAPNLAQHEDEILKRLGYDDRTISMLKEKWSIIGS